MRIAFIIYNGMTALDFIGVFDPVTRLKAMGIKSDLQWEICSRTPEVSDVAGLRIMPTQVNQPLNNFDMIIVPGGFIARRMVNDQAFIEWLKTAMPCSWKVSVCTGSLLLGAAGYLYGKKATTHPSAYENLQPYCATVIDQRIVEDGDVITARGVTSAIDLGLYLCEKFAGHDIKEKIRQQMDYGMTFES